MLEIRNDTASKEQMQFNQRINFYIMRTIWAKKRRNSEYTIYDLTGISRTRYTNLLDDLGFGLKQSEIDKIVHKLNIDAEYLTGQYMIHIDGMQKKHWKAYFKYRNDRRNNEIHKDEIAIENVLEKIGVIIEKKTPTLRWMIKLEKRRTGKKSPLHQAHPA